LLPTFMKALRETAGFSFLRPRRRFLPAYFRLNT